MATVPYIGNELWVPGSIRNYLPCEVKPPRLDLDEYEQHCLFKFRITLVLVCKSWYFMAVPLLWRHVRIIVNEKYDHLASISETLKNDPSFASHIRRLSVHTTLPMSSEHTQLLKETLVRLTRLQFVSLPRLRGSIPMSTGIVLRYGGLENTSVSDPVPSTLPGITHIVAKEASAEEVRWFSGVWDLSSVCVLSATGRVSNLWAQTLRSMVQLEKLELLMSSRLLVGNEMPEYLDMPKLKMLCLSFPTNSLPDDFLQLWFDYIRAPNLQRLVLHPISFKNPDKLENHNRNYLLNKLQTVTNDYPKLRQFAIFTEKARIISREGKGGLIAREDIDTWTAHNLTVEILRGHEFDRRVYKRDQDPAYL